jgi:hypothetical protein
MPVGKGKTEYRRRMTYDHGGGKKQAEKSHVSGFLSFHIHPAMNGCYFLFQSLFRRMTAGPDLSNRPRLRLAFCFARERQVA